MLPQASGQPQAEGDQLPRYTGGSLKTKTWTHFVLGCQHLVARALPRELIFIHGRPPTPAPTTLFPVNEYTADFWALRAVCGEQEWGGGGGTVACSVQLALILRCTFPSHPPISPGV